MTSLYAISNIPQFDKTGFMVDDFEKPQQSSQVVNGVKYDMVEFKTNIYPNRLGDLTFGPAQIQGNVLYKTGQENPFNQDNDFFGTNIFNNFFDSYATRPVTVTSQPILLHVSPLPEDNRPQDFSGAIGQFDFQANVSPLQVKAGDPLTLKMDVKGSGNFKNLQMPVFKAPGFKSYEPQIKDVGDEKIAEEVIIPTPQVSKKCLRCIFLILILLLKTIKRSLRGLLLFKSRHPALTRNLRQLGFLI